MSITYAVKNQDFVHFGTQMIIQKLFHVFRITKTSEMK